MAKDRPPSFQFYPMDYLADTGPLSDRQGRRYMDGMCRSWLCGAYGIGTPEDWRTWMGYSLASEWEADQVAMERMFFVTPSEPVHWIQKRMVVERQEQAARFAQAQRGGKVRATEARRDGGRFTSPAPAGHQPSTSTAGEATSIAGEQHQPITSRPPGPSSSSSSSSSKTDSKDFPRAVRVEWEKGFDLFWEDYPKKVGRAAALKAWMKLKNPTEERAQALFDWVLAGLEWWKLGEWREREAQYIPHAATWINQRRWTDVANPGEMS